LTTGYSDSYSSRTKLPRCDKIGCKVFFLLLFKEISQDHLIYKNLHDFITISMLN